MLFICGEKGELCRRKVSLVLYVFKTMYRKQGTVTIQYKMFVFS